VGNDTEFLFGHDLLIAPKLEEGLNPMEVMLPSGDWFNYWTGKKASGPHQFKIHPALDELPVYVRAGAIIPEQPLVQSTAEVPQGPLELRVYPGPDCKGSLYWDEGDGFGYQRGNFYRQAFTCSVSPSGVTVNLNAVQGSYTPWWKSIKVVLYDARQPKAVTLNGESLKNEAANGATSFEIPATRNATKVEITY
jgi:alpha-glucosidase